MSHSASLNSPVFITFFNRTCGGSNGNATQAELDAHAADADAHHSRYTDTEARDAVGGTLTLADDRCWANGQRYVDCGNGTVTGAGRSAREDLAATGARKYSIGSFRTAKMEIPDQRQSLLTG